MNNKLALLGGRPIKEEEYPIHNTIFDEAEKDAVLSVLESGHLSGFSARPGERFLGGPYVQKMERDFEKYFEVKYAISFNSATSALHAALAASGVGPGDEVITSPTTMSATATSIVMTNGVPVFADIEEDTFGLNPLSVEKLINENTKGILTVNLFGHPSMLQDLRAIADKYGLFLIEDNAQAPAAKYQGDYTGTIGDMGILSPNYHKTIQTGEGGLVLTNNTSKTEKLRLIRNHGEVVVGLTELKNIENIVGWNYRLTEIQAAIGLEQLKKLNYLNTRRSELAERLSGKLKEFNWLRAPIIKKDCSHVFYLYPILFDQSKIGINRDMFVKAMNAEGIALSSGYAKPIYLEPMYQQKIAYGRQQCPFKCPLYTGKVNYDSGLCPTAESLYFEKIIVTDICKYPNQEKDIDDFYLALKKIVENIDQLKSKTD